MTRSRTRALLAAAAASTVLLAACGTNSTASPDTTAAPATTAAPTTTVALGDIVEVASGNADFSTLVAAVQAAGLVETLQGEGPFTVFAPTNDAFAALPEGLVDALLLPENVETLKAILTYHVVPGKVLAADVAAGDVATVQGENVTLSTAGGVKVNESNVIATDVMASNGVIHVIDSVLVPPTVDVAALLAGDIVEVASGNADFSTLVAAVQAAGLVETLQGDGPFTVFAPTNEAFAALPEGLVDALLLPENVEVLQAILTYHVVPAKVLAADVADGEVATVQGEEVTLSTAGGVKVNEATVVATDVMASNGVIHVIDSVLVPPSIDVAALLVGDIVEVASGNADFSTLVAAVQAAGLVETLQGDGPFTVFAPTNAAFAALPAGVLERLLLPENKDLLVSILTYHVVPGKVLAADVVDGEVATAQGGNVVLSTLGGVKVNQANVVATDVMASNGVIHVIDAVLLPPGVDLH
jgi:transforming growth factor-beta-induced protein